MRHLTARKALPLHAGNWFYVNEIFQHIQDHQVRNRLESNQTKRFREYPNIPLAWKDMSWHDKRFIEEYMGNRTRMYYQQNMFFDEIGKKIYN